MNDELKHHVHIGIIGNGRHSSREFIEAVMKYLNEHPSTLEDEVLPNIDIPDISKILSTRPLERKRKRVN